MTQQEKLEIIRYLIFLRGKLQGLAIELLMLGENPASVDAAEKNLAAHIENLRVNMMRHWQGSATDLMEDLRDKNERAQRHLRELQNAQNRAAKIAEILNLIDRGFASVLSLIP